MVPRFESDSAAAESGYTSGPSEQPFVDSSAPHHFEHLGSDQYVVPYFYNADGYYYPLVPMNARAMRYFATSEGHWYAMYQDDAMEWLPVPESYWQQRLPATLEVATSEAELMASHTNAFSINSSQPCPPALHVEPEMLEHFPVQDMDPAMTSRSSDSLDASAMYHDHACPGDSATAQLHVHHRLEQEQVQPTCYEMRSQSTWSIPPTSPLEGKPELTKRQTTVMACYFCHGRKIACGGAAPDNSDGDKTCRQCKRRGKICIYPKFSRRGYRRRTHPEFSVDPAELGQAERQLGYGECSGANNYLPTAASVSLSPTGSSHSAGLRLFPIDLTPGCESPMQLVPSPIKVEEMEVNYTVTCT